MVRKLRAASLICGNECLDFEGMYAGIECELPRGHEGKHAMHYEWDNGQERTELLLTYMRVTRSKPEVAGK